MYALSNLTQGVKTMQNANKAAQIAYGKRTVRVITMNGVPKFSATDICNILGYVNPNKTIGRFCDSSPEYIKIGTTGGPQNVRMIGIDDIRSILARSRHKNVRRFRNWFENKVFPAVIQPEYVLCGVAMLVPFKEVRGE
jgi:prophage antirepressor-like protein